MGIPLLAEKVDAFCFSFNLLTGKSLTMLHVLIEMTPMPWKVPFPVRVTKL